jgi:LCP family protein required for cell wall assembly
MTHTSNEGPKVTVLETEELQIPEEVQQDETMKGYMNIALFGVDATKESLLYKGSRSDSIMIASINMDTGDIKLVSVYRDTYLNIGTDSYQKCNAAYSYGGAEQAVKMLNMNLDMDITNFVTVGYKGLSEVIDGLGGIYIDVDSEEIKHINNYQIGIAEVLKCDYTPVTETGMQLLNGLQATAYCRIRYTAGNDFKRAAVSVKSFRQSKIRQRKQIMQHCPRYSTVPSTTFTPVWIPRTSWICWAIFQIIA